MLDILDSDCLSRLLNSGDVFILDRGFRDCISDLNEHGYQTKMPALLGKNQKQLTTMEANESRLVTKLRYVVEVTNCFCKRSFQALREVQNQSLKHTIEDYKIAGALINK